MSQADLKSITDRQKAELIEQRKIFAKAIKKTSSATQKLYAQRGEYWWGRISQGDWPHDHTMARGTWQSTRSGVRWYASMLAVEGIDRALKKADRGELTRAEWLDIQRTIERATDIHYAYPVGRQKQETQPEIRRMKESKKIKLKRLPENWRERMWEAATGPGVKDRRPHLAMLALTGARPEELHKGIQIRRVGDDAIEFTIQGAKLREARGDEVGHGQEWRKFRIDEVSDSVEGRFLIELMEHKNAERGRAYSIAGPTPDVMRKYVDRTAKRAFPDIRNPGISPYTYRQSFFSRLKAQGVKMTDISGGGGQQSTRSPGWYGRRTQSNIAGKGGRISGIEYATPVRDRQAERNLYWQPAEREQAMDRGDDMEW
ncbi:hypothetical protein TspCOW1_21570 [Thiohalobacter sp. COW1]|uniref:hypothetical protein n=1 Tax=Thiohalobacter sp. COW1 TaxID=2795687 RepID=UPI001916AF67|nr:hypothetical protein [Thiohalobacter sp. COW1]BCO32054.1 hypothetical protein TspCOW1_21570 [Thiohalobacter sp. COW1]